jgi:hypothetical protein
VTPTPGVRKSDDSPVAADTLFQERAPAASGTAPDEGSVMSTSPTRKRLRDRTAERAQMRRRTKADAAGRHATHDHFRLHRLEHGEHVVADRQRLEQPGVERGRQRCFFDDSCRKRLVLLLFLSVGLAGECACQDEHRDDERGHATPGS